MKPEEPGVQEPGRHSPPEDDPLVQLLASLEEGVREAVEEFSDGLERSVSKPLRDAFAGAADAHSRLVEETRARPDSEAFGSGVESPAADDGEPGGPLSPYRIGVLTEVLDPLRDFLLATNTASRLETEWTSFRAKLLRLSAALPSEVHRSEPSDLYLRKQGDRFARTAGKGLARARRWWASALWKLLYPLRRLSGRGADHPPARVQAVPVRSVAMRYVEGPLTLALEPLRDDMHRHYALPLAALETGLARWLRAWPPSAWEAEREAGYLTPDLREEVTELLGRVSESDEGLSTDAQEGGGKDPNAAPSPMNTAWELSTGLSPGKTLEPPLNILQDLDSALTSEWLTFREYLDASGSFMRSSPPNTSLRKARKASRRSDDRAETWLRWHRSIPSRLLLAIHLQRFQNQALGALGHLANGGAEGAITPLVNAWSNCSDDMRTLKERADAAFAEARSSADTATLTGTLEGLRDEGVRVLEETWLEPLASHGIERNIRELADATSTGIAGFLRELPETLSVQELQSQDHRVDPAKGFREIRLRESAQQVLDVLRLEKLRNAPAPLLDVLAMARAEADKLIDILRFNLDAAMEEIAPSPGGSLATSLQEAASLTAGGIERTEEAISLQLVGLPDAWRAFVSSAEQLLASAFLEVHGKATLEGGVQGQIVGLRDRASHRLRSETVRARRLAASGSTATRRLFRKASIRVLRAVRAGRSAVGAAPVASGEGERALAIIRQAPEILSDLPLIYRRLFSFDPLTEKGLLKGRTQETAWVQGRFQQWELGMGTPVLLTGPVGAGHTSFFNVLSTTVFSNARLHRLELMERISGERELAAQIAEAFGLPSDDPWDFTRLARAIRGFSVRAKPRVILIERLEHIFLRTPGGTDLFEDFLSLQLQTSEKVFWLSSMSGAAWKLVAKTEPRSASLVQVRPLTAPSREALEELILERHRRSGLPLEFHAPPDLNPLVRRRLRLSPSDRARQRILQTEYFDRLFRLSQESIPMAILHWLRSTDFRSGEGRLVVTPPPEVRYGFLEELDLDLYFALKAFLEHGSLTLQEYREVFAASEDESFQTFKALGSRLLLEPTGRRDGIPRTLGDEFEEGERYRIPALLSQVVAQRLKDRNILH